MTTFYVISILLFVGTFGLKCILYVYLDIRNGYKISYGGFGELRPLFLYKDDVQEIDEPIKRFCNKLHPISNLTFLVFVIAYILNLYFK
jgi:hypothetical protein